MPTFNGRVEAKLTVPTGGATVSASNGAQSAATTVTVPAASYYLTSAGGVSSLLTTLQAQLNQNVLPFPTTAAALQSAIGYGTWTGGAGYLMQEASGNLAATFGAPTLTANSLTYRNAGTTTGDYAIGFDNTATDYADGGANFDIGANDLFVAAVLKFGAATTASLFSKVAAAIASGWAIYLDGTNLNIAAVDGAGIKVSSLTAAGFLNEWCALMACVDRSTGKMRVGLRGLTSGTTLLGGESAVSGNITTASPFRMGNDAWLGAASTASVVSALYVVTGASVATGASANLSTALANFASAVNSTWSASLSTSDGRVTLAHSFWPSSISFTDTTLRDLIGFAFDFDYPQTAAQMAAAVGYGTWSAGYLLNESSGSVAPVFGSASLSPGNSPTYSQAGPRGGNDKAIKLDNAPDYFAAASASTYDVTSGQDLIFAWVGKVTTLTGTQFTRLCSKSTFGGGGGVYQVGANGPTNGNTFIIDCDNGTATCSALFEEWHVGIAVLDAGSLKIGVKGLATGTKNVGATLTGKTITTNVAGFILGGYSDNPNGWTCAAMYIATGAGVASGLASNLSAALDNFATYMKSQTGTKQARGLWFPDCPLALDGDPDQAPKITDARSTINPSRSVITLVGNSGRRHTGVHWSHVPKTRAWESLVTYANASWEYFANECLLGLGSSWFTPASDLQIYYDSNGVQKTVGNTFNSGAGVSGWQVPNFDRIDPKKAVGDWDGFYRIELGNIESDG